MKKTIKTAIASVMSVVVLVTGATSMDASAESETVYDNYSRFYYYKNVTSAGCELNNLSNSPQYAQVYMAVYTIYGTYYPSNTNPTLPNGSTISCYYNGYYVGGVEFFGSLSSGTTVLSCWHTSL